MSHTKEPWVFGQNGEIIGSGGLGDTVCMMVDEEIIEPNAHRIVACVNACAGIPNEDLEVDNSTFIRMLKERNTKDDRIAALEAKVRELEAIDAARTNAVQEAIDNAAIYQDQLAASRQQVERLVKALTILKFRGGSPEAKAIAIEALAAVEKERT